jgi:hypothetical protein
LAALLTHIIVGAGGDSLAFPLYRDGAPTLCDKTGTRQQGIGSINSLF